MCFLGKKVLIFEFAIEAIVIFVKNLQKGIKWYIHFICKSKSEQKRITPNLPNLQTYSTN